jgi:hypothetical protein
MKSSLAGQKSRSAIATRAILSAGIALLLADRLIAEQRKAVGSTLVLVGLVTTIPAVWAIFGKCE